MFILFINKDIDILLMLLIITMEARGWGADPGCTSVIDMLHTLMIESSALAYVADFYPSSF